MPAAAWRTTLFCERDVLDRRPRRAAVLVAHGEEDGEAVLRVRPVALEEVALDEHAPRVLQLEEVLHRPRLALVARARRPSTRAAWRRWLPRISMSDGTRSADRRVGAAEHHVLARRLEVVVHDAERPRPVPARDRLRVGADLLEVGEVASRPSTTSRAFERDAPPRAAVAVAVDVAALEDQVVRQAARATWRRRRARPGSSGRRRPAARSRPRRTGSDARPAPRRSRVPPPRPSFGMSARVRRGRRGGPRGAAPPRAPRARRRSTRRPTFAAA